MPMRAGSSQPKPRLLRGRAFIKVERGPKGRAAGQKIYNYALAHDFRFLSYGDSSLLIP